MERDPIWSLEDFKSFMAIVFGNQPEVLAETEEQKVIQEVRRLRSIEEWLEMDKKTRQ